MCEELEYLPSFEAAKYYRQMKEKEAASKEKPVKNKDKKD